MSRGISDPSPSINDSQATASQDNQSYPGTDNQLGNITNDDIMDFMDQLALLIRDLDTRLMTIERLLVPVPPVTLPPRSEKSYLNGQ